MKVGMNECLMEAQKLPTEITELYDKKGASQEKTEEAAAKNGELAVELRDDACKTFGQKMGRRIMKQEQAAATLCCLFATIGRRKELCSKQLTIKRADLEQERLEFKRQRFAEETVFLKK